MRRPAAVTERPADLTIFFSSDTRGMLRRCGCSEGQLGGLSARASYLKSRRGNGSTLVLDAGDTLFDGMEAAPEKRDFYLLKSRTLLKAMEQSGYDAVALGEYDFSYGPDFLADGLNGVSLLPLAANLSDDTGTLKYTGSLIKSLHGLSVGVIGVMDNAFPFGSFKQSFRGVRVSGASEAAQRQIDGLQGKADLVVVLAHLSVTGAEGFVKGLKGADIVIQGHSQEILERPKQVGGTLLVKGFNKGKRIGRLDIWLCGNGAGSGGGRIVDYRYSVIPLDESIPPDPEVERITAGYREELKKRKFVFTASEPAGSASYTGPEECKGCHEREYANWSGTAHAAAYGSLVRTGDQYDPECLPCHTTGFGSPAGYSNQGAPESLRNVSCESCHGRGGEHSSMRKTVGEDVCRGCHDDYNSPRFEYEEYKAKGGAHRGGVK